MTCERVRALQHLQGNFPHNRHPVKKRSKKAQLTVTKSDLKKKKAQ